MAKQVEYGLFDGHEWLCSLEPLTLSYDKDEAMKFDNFQAAQDFRTGNRLDAQYFLPIQIPEGKEKKAFKFLVPVESEMPSEKPFKRKREEFENVRDSDHYRD